MAMESVPAKRVKLDNEKFNIENNNFYTDEMEVSVIDILDDDCMEIIFSFLNMVDLIKIERVSKKWRELSLRSWRNFKNLNVVEDFGRNFDTKHLEDILKRCGDHLTHLDLMVFQSGPEDNIPLIINKYCKNLMHLGIQTYEDCKNNWTQLEDSVIKHLKSLFIGDKRICLEFRSNCGYNELPHILKSAVSLEKIHLVAFSYKWDGRCLLHLTDTCIELSVQCCTDINPYIFTQVLKKIPRLKKLNISQTLISPQDLLTVSDQLISLHVTQMQSDFFSRDQYPFLIFQNLRELDLACNKSVNDKNLGILISRCSLLEKLNLTGCVSITDDGFLNLGKLKKLMCLHISITHISNAAFTKLGQITNKLQELHCYCCENITDTGLISLVASCSELKYLNFEIDMHRRVDHKFFQLVLNSVQIRPNKVSLTIHILLYFDDPLKKDFKTIMKDEAERLKLRNRPSKLNVCKVKFTDLCASKETLNKVESWYVADTLS